MKNGSGALRANIKRLRRGAHSGFFNFEKLGKNFLSVNALY
jgi:hypothetical protein